MSNRYSAFMFCHTNAICHFRVTDHVKGSPGTQFVTPFLHHFNLSSLFPLVYVVYHLQLTHSVTGVANLHRKPMFLMQPPPPPPPPHCSNLMRLLYAKQSLDLYDRMHFDQRCLSLSLSLCISDIRLRSWLSELNISLSTMTAQSDQGKWHPMRSVEVHCLCQFLAALLVSCP